MADYQKSLNLPKTDFSMRANLASKEPQQLEKWNKEGVYAAIRKKSDGKKPFTLHDGPPYANGHIHIGHALNKILKDMIVKMKTMQGYDSLYIPGWDCHGLPIEHQLFKELKKRKSDIKPLEFRKKAHAFALKYVEIQREEFKRLGIFGEWAKPYLTLTPEYEYWILKSFSRLAQSGYIYRGLKPVNWCCQCETALAEAEVEYEDHISPSVTVKFKVSHAGQLDGLPSGKPLYLLIWTTTPWTLLANVAVAVHRHFHYACVDTGKEVLIVERSLAARVLEKGNIPEFQIIKDIPGNALDHIHYDHPFQIKKDCRVITVDYITKEEGTGLVHTAPGHGLEDYEAGLAHSLEVLMPVNDSGVFSQDAGEFAGQHVFKANERIIAALQARGTLFAEEKISHSYPHCWRCKKPIIFRATKQWFLKIDHRNLRSELKKTVQSQIQWFPPAGEDRMSSMVTTRPDWCLSRQRYWGVPIPALACLGCGGELQIYPEVIEHFAEMVKIGGTDIWFEKNVKELIPEGFTCPSCKKDSFEKTYDILDVWFDSGVSHQAVICAMMKRSLPVEMYLEGSDQHRGWFQSSLIPALALEGKPPFSAVLTHGFVVDGQGRKMSKSLGNVISPQEIIKNNGADILRLWVASSSYHEDIRISKEILERLIDAYRKIRNTFRYLLGNLYDFEPQNHTIAYEQLADIDKWALDRLAALLHKLKDEYNAYEFAKVYKMIYAFCNEDLSGFYLDILKDRLYTSHVSSPERRSAQTVLYHILNNLVRSVAPILSFTSEEVYVAMPKDPQVNSQKSIHTLNWLDIPGHWQNHEIGRKFEQLIALRPFVLKALEDQRREGKIGSSLEAKVIFQTDKAEEDVYLREFKDILASTFIISQVEIQKVGKVEKGLSESLVHLAIMIEKAEGQKCGRCWNYKTDVGEDQEHMTLCGRCSRVVKALNEEQPA